MTLPLALLVACSGDDGDSAPTDTDADTTDTEVPGPTGDTAAAPPGPDLVLTDVHNYTYDAAWTFQSVPVRSSFEVVLSWSGLTADAWGVARDPSSYDAVLLFELGIPAAEAAERLANDALSGAPLVSTWRADAAGRAFVSTSALMFESTPFDPVSFLVEDPSRTWLFALADRAGDRDDVRAAVVIVPTDLVPTTRVELVDTSSAHSWSAGWAGEPLRTAGVHERYTLDWRGLDADVHGNEYDRFTTDELFVGHWDAATPEVLMAEVHDLGASADAWWTMGIEGDDEARLELARDAGGVRFGGFTAGGTWLVGARCTTCLGPAPRWLTVVEVE